MFTIDFIHGSAGGDVYVKDAEQFYIYHKHFPIWHCGALDENQSCKRVEEGLLAWGGKYHMHIKSKGIL